ncbi:MAG: Integral membrane protein [uncultured Nocardioidaceae bacterium]|uniref:Integral membrane protein n=1 Tax=uncultured Nocardioidaceae bacterium TaxID=253824 RepID=A0A6J4N6Y6_9ACTN|nr:MAG: Integral membrane protein [uncultured Nocardioidaceae bacterium]
MSHDQGFLAEERRAGRLRLEVAVVLALSLGQSAVYSVISLTAKLTEPGGLGSQTATLNPSVTPRPLLDLAYQLANIAFALVPVVLVVFLLGAGGDSAARRLGLDLPRRRVALTDLAFGAGLAALIGIPGLGFYYLARTLGLNAMVVPSGLTEHWWTIPVLVLAAVENAVLEEVVAVGYLMTRLRGLGVGAWPTLAASALLRGSYHLYQGFGAFVGNVAMGLVFGYFYQRRGRVMPLIVAHALIDIVAFVGYTTLRDELRL